MSELAELKSDSTELQGFLQVAKRPRVKDVLKNELASVDAKIGEMESKRAKEEEKAATAEPKEAPSVAADPNSKPVAVAKPFKEVKVQRSKITSYGFDQKPTTFTIYIELPGVGSLEKDQVNVEFTKQSLNIVVSNLNGKTHELNLPNLGGEIIPENCKYKVKPDKIMVTLKKADEGDWTGITAKEVKVKKEKEKEKEKEKAETRSVAEDSEADPSTGLMDLMKKMYDEGDDEMKRTIAKAWTESREKQAAGETPGMGM